MLLSKMKTLPNISASTFIPSFFASRQYARRMCFSVRYFAEKEACL
ncbi:hypothetical protein B4168_1741 [Anoxybacillus flavithermus]|nr:hypothetical protein B4168_1741 [Anoxybacillus flavithermus]OAO87829.1 hypothetical protein GT23_0886 [Parageobacillus thermoglucosidasius]